MSTPEKHEPDQKTAPQQEPSTPAQMPEPKGDAAGGTMNLASKSNSKQSWKGIS